MLIVENIRYQQESKFYRVRSDSGDNGLSGRCYKASHWACKSSGSLPNPGATSSSLCFTERRSEADPGWSVILRFCGELTLREDREIKAVSACAGAVRASGLGACMWVCVSVCIRACGLLASRDLSLPSGFGACGVDRVKFRNQILLLILLFTGTDRFLLLSKLKTL